MGQTIRNLAKRESLKQAIFNNRMVVEACEDFHFHYRNLRLAISYADWASFAKGFSDAYLRWEKQGKPFGNHTELCRKTVATNVLDQGIKINLNKNLYKKVKGVFSLGADFNDEEYIHVKIRDMRLEMSKEEFTELADCFAEAKEALNER